MTLTAAFASAPELMSSPGRPARLDLLHACIIERGEGTCREDSFHDDPQALPLRGCQIHQASGKMPMNQKRTTAKTAKNGITQPSMALVSEETWKDSLGLAGL